MGVTRFNLRQRPARTNREPRPAGRSGGPAIAGGQPFKVPCRRGAPRTSRGIGALACLLGVTLGPWLLAGCDQTESVQRGYRGVALTQLKVDGGMVVNELLMQFQADVLGVPVIRPQITETTALGAAYAAGLAVGYWSDPNDLRSNWAMDKSWQPQMDDVRRRQGIAQWQKAIQRTLGWMDD